jgi:ethanolamine ammonia-lyase small subunit
LEQAAARGGIYAELNLELLEQIAPFRIIETQAATKEDYLGSPSLGGWLGSETRNQLTPENTQVQILVSDGLNAEAAHENLPGLLPALQEGLESCGLHMGQPMAARYGRVKLAEEVAECLQTDLVIFLIGERPGSDPGSSRSLSAYLVYRLGDTAVQRLAAEFSSNPSIRFESTVFSNIHPRGIAWATTAKAIVDKASQILEHRAAGNRLEPLLKAK